MPTHNPIPRWDETTDIVVVGSGIAGLAAAIEATSAGADVVVLEKMKIIGGNTRLSDGGLAAPGNPIQIKEGIQDSADLFFRDITKAGLGLNHPQLAKVLAEQANSAVAWTMEELGVDYQNRLDRFGGHSVARCITTKRHRGIDLIKAASFRLNRLGVNVWTGCILDRLVSDQRGHVAGVAIRRDYVAGQSGSGNTFAIRAKRAVVLATGGFANDISFRMLQNPSLTASLGSTNHRGATAEALIASLQAGAAPVHLSWIQLGPWGCADEKGYGKGASFASYSVYPTGIVIDPRTGHRIVNEWTDRRRRSDAILKTGCTCIGIVDSNGARKSSGNLQSCLKRGSVVAFDTWSDIASHYQIPRDTLEETIHSYNRGVGDGETDRFGKDLGVAFPLASPPFYGIRLWPKIHYTPGGVGITPDAQVMDLYGNPIPNLYAAGEVCGGIHGASRLGSCALVDCVVFGRIAGRHAVLGATASNLH